MRVHNDLNLVQPWLFCRFTSDLSDWNVSRVITLESTFQNAITWNGNLSLWDVGRVTDFSYAFYGAESFTGTGLANWNTSSATTMHLMFYGATSLSNANNISSWQVGSVVDMEFMFRLSSLNQDLCAWGQRLPATGVSVTDMFLGTDCPSMTSPNAGNLAVGPWCYVCNATTSGST